MVWAMKGVMVQWIKGVADGAVRGEECYRATLLIYSYFISIQQIILYKTVIRWCLSKNEENSRCIPNHALAHFKY